jgi:hypothetical protein
MVINMVKFVDGCTTKIVLRYLKVSAMRPATVGEVVSFILASQLAGHPVLGLYPYVALGSTIDRDSGSKWTCGARLNDKQAELSVIAYEGIWKSGFLFMGVPA